MSANAHRIISERTVTISGDGAQFNFDKLETTGVVSLGNFKKKRFSWHSDLDVGAKLQ